MLRFVMTRVALVLPAFFGIIFLTFLVPKLPAPEEKDLSKGILKAIDSTNGE